MVGLCLGCDAWEKCVLGVAVLKGVCHSDAISSGGSL